MFAVVAFVIGTSFESSPEGLHGTRPQAVAVQDLGAASPAPDCREWTDCRQLALEAAARKEYETFHDLAWRAVQLGPKKDPALLFMLARAQSLSGRAHDALVMLRRLAPTGAGRDALASPEFERVRALREWPEVEALLSAPAAPSEPPRPEPASAPKPAVAAPRAREPSVAAVPRGAPASAPRDALAFDAASFKPAVLAYDAVSRRFIIGDADVSRLAVIDEFSRQIATLASGRSAGFATVTAIAIDPRVGDLWVASVDGASGADVPSLHKLQLISGRVLKQVQTTKAAAGRFADVAVARDGTVVAVQESGEVLRLSPGAASLALAATVPGEALTSVAIAADGSIYLAGARGVLRLQQGRAAALRAPAGVDLSGIARIRWSRESLIALQRTGNSTGRVVRVRPGRDGHAIARVDVLDPAIDTPNPAAVALAGDVFYYLTGTGGPELEIRKIIIK